MRVAPWGWPSAPRVNSPRPAPARHLRGDFARLGTGASTVTLNPGSFVGVDTGSGNVTYGTAITNAGVGLNKLGDNSLILTAAETYTGATSSPPAPSNLAMAPPVTMGR